MTKIKIVVKIVKFYIQLWDYNNCDSNYVHQKLVNETSAEQEMGILEMFHDVTVKLRKL